MRANVTPHLSIPALVVLALSGPGAALGQTNVALGGTATQSSDLFGDGVTGNASLAIDGDTNGVFWDGSVTHTDAAVDSAPSWEVDLGSAHQIDQIVIWNRTDCCAARLYDFSVEVVTEDGLLVPIGRYPGIPGVDFSPPLPPAGVVGRIVRIRLELDPANLGGRYLSLAEVQVFGSATSEPPADPLLSGRELRLTGWTSQKMKTAWDGPKDVTKKLLKRLRRETGRDFEKIPYICGWSAGSVASIRFDADVSRFELIAAGGTASGTVRRKGPGGEKLKLKVDPTSEESLERMLFKSVSDCIHIDDGEEPTEEILKLKVRLKKARLEARIEDGSTLRLSAKLRGRVKWKKEHRNDRIGKFRGSGRATEKLVLSAALEQEAPPLPAECRADGRQGRHVYPTPGAQFEGWIELTEIRDSDRYYLILSESFVSILEDFEEDHQSVAALLAVVDATGEQCFGDGRTRVAIELTEFGKENLLDFLQILKSVEIAITLFFDYLEQLFTDFLIETIFPSSPVGQLADEYKDYVVQDVLGIPLPAMDPSKEGAGQ